MTEERLVECQDCGYRWESSAENPRCSKADCGRSRNVEDVADDLDGEDESEEIDETSSTDMDPSDEQAEEATDTEPDEEDEGGGYTPAFETEQTRTDTERAARSTSSTSTDEEDEQEDADDEAEVQESEEASSGPSTDAEIPELEPEQLVPAFEATFNVAATKRGDHWELDDDEAQQLATGWCPVINHYAPHMLREHTVLGAAIITTYGVLGPRLAKDAELAEQDERQAERQRDTEAGSTRYVEDEGDGLDLGGQLDEEDSTEQTSEEAAPGGYAAV